MTVSKAQQLKQEFVDSLAYRQGVYPAIAKELDWYLAIASAVRDRLLKNWVDTTQLYAAQDARVVAYFSAEYLLGPHLGNALLNLEIEADARQAMKELSLDPERIFNQEEEPGLGNGGLGRLAACYMDSLTTLSIPAIGYGIRYEYGIFDQEIRDGWQVEITDRWLQWGNPWEIARPASACTVGFGGHTEAYTDAGGRYRVRWIPAYAVRAVPYDTPIPGYRTKNVNTLRLWKSEAINAFNLSAFNAGDYLGSVRDNIESENISKILYPNDEQVRGKMLRLEQQYFFVSAALQDMIRLHLRQGRKLGDFAEKWAAQMNDTHPSIAVAELMRLLVDEYSMDWDAAWTITQKTLAYTNHTLLPEALEKWTVELFGGLLPRHLEIVYEINRRFLEEARHKFPGDEQRIRALSLIDESGSRSVRMAHLATVGSHSVNGVAALHSELLKTDVLRDLYAMYPERFNNKTNGVTPRRWLALSNPSLAALITEAIGEDWLWKTEELRKLEAHLSDAGFRDRWRESQLGLKRKLAAYVNEKTGIAIEPTSLFDTMVKRIHEYKRQHLNVLHIVTLYQRLKRDPGAQIAPRTFLFGGKAAPSYAMAKLMIKLIHSVAEVVNRDPQIAGRLKVVFLPDYNVKFGQRVYPAADLSEQISLAGKEASGTGNMKFAMNGALTIGTLDGANVEIREAVGAENFFLFGMTAAEVYARRSGYNHWDIYDSNPLLRAVIDGLYSGEFSHGDRNLFRPLFDTDPYMLFADYASYIECQDRVDQTYRDHEKWTRMSILNTARTGWFSSDRAIQEYCDDIWRVKPTRL